MDIRQKNRTQSLLQEEGPVTILTFEDGNIMLSVINAEGRTNPTTYQAGPIQDILQKLQSEPATASELETAITVIEGQLEAVIPSLPAHRCLVTSEPVIKEIAGLSQGTDDSRLEISEVERLFNGIVDIAYGTPAKLLGLPENREFTATLLYLRELMHHADLPSVLLLKS